MDQKRLIIHKATQRLLSGMGSFIETNKPAPYIVILWEIFKDRHDRNPRYTLRAFARDLDLDLGHLSRILTGKRVLRSRTAIDLCEKLLLEDEKQKEFVASVLVSNKRKKKAPPQTNLTLESPR